MFREMAGAVLKRRLRHSPTIPQTVDEAASQYLGKQAKMEVALDGVFAKQLHDIAEDEVAAVQQYRQKNTGIGGTLGPGGKKGTAVGDFIVCDDYQRGLSPITVAVIVIVAILAIVLVAAMAAWGATVLMKHDEQKPVTANAIDTEYEVRFFDRDGNPITIPHISQKPAE